MDVSIRAEGLVLKLPHSYVSLDESKRPLIKCFDFSAEVRGTLNYLDINVSTSPLTFHIPTDERTVTPMFLQLQGIDYHWHISYGPIPTVYAYKSRDSLEIGSITG